MKKLFNFAILSIMMIFAFTSCKNVTEDGYIPNAAGKAQVTLRVAQVPTARTILPDAWDDTSKGKLFYKLSADNLMYTAEKETHNFTWADLQAGTKAVSLTASRWSLKMEAFTSEQKRTDGTSPILSSTVIVDLRNGDSTVTFDLRPVGTENGSVNITVNYKKPQANPDVLQKVTIGLYKDPSDDAAESDLTATDNALTGTSINLKCDNNVPPGKHYLGVKFYNKDDVLLMPYYEVVYVDPGHLSSKTITLPDIINVPPKAPEQFKVTYLKNTPGTVTVKFSWNDMAINETGFELVVTEYKNSTTPLEPAKTYTKDTDLKLTPEYVDGKLSARVDTAAPNYTLNLKTGTLYKAKVRAVNGFGESEYLEYTNTDSENFINLNVITMHLNGGTVKPNATKAEQTSDVYYGIGDQAAYTDHVGEIYSYTYSTSKTYTLPVAETDQPSWIKRDKFTFEGWYHLIPSTDGNGGQLDYLGPTQDSPKTGVTEYGPKSYGNDTVYALWNAKATITVTFPEYTDKDNLLVTQVGDVFYKNIDVGTKIDFAGPEGYTSYRWYVDGVEKASVQKWSYVTEGTEMEAMNHSVMLEVEDITGQHYSNTVFIRVKNTVTAAPAP